MQSNPSDTYKMIDFLGKQFHKNTMIKRQTKLSNASKHLMYGIIHQMELAENAWKLCTSYNEYILPENTIPKGNSYDFITEEIKANLSVSKKIGKRYLFTIGSRNFTIYLIQPYHRKNIHIKNTYHTMDLLIKKIFICLFTLCYYSKDTSCSLKHLTVYIYLSDNKKILPNEKGEPIDKNHANSAFTYSCSMDNENGNGNESHGNESHDNEIYIFRREECLKVLIHECFHSMGLDFSNRPQHEVDAKIAHVFKHIFNPDCIDCNNIRFYETYCEMWAELVNIIFICVTKYKKHNSSGVMTIMDMKKVCKQIESYIQLETLFSLFQSSKILHHYDLTYRELFVPPSDKNSTDSTEVKYKENTNVFSYYFLKTICMFHSNEFIEWCGEHNHNSLAFHPTQKNIVDFFLFISERYDSTEFLRNMDIFDKWFSLEREQDSKTDYIFEMSTLRMSISEEEE